MPSIYPQKKSPFYWIRYYDKNESDPNKRRKAFNTKINITPGDLRRITDRKKGEPLKLQGTSELKKMLSEFKSGLAQLQLENKTGIKLKKSPLLSEGLKEYLFYKPNLKHKTITAYNYAVDLMIIACTDKLIAKYKYKDYILLIRYCKELVLNTKKKDKKEDIQQDKQPHPRYNETSIAIITRHLHPLWNYFVKQKYTNDNIIQKIKTPKGIPHPIPEKELRQILLYYKDKGIKTQNNAVRFLLLTGLRPSSAIAQQWEWIDLEQDMMTVLNVKANRFFIFPIHSELKKLLLEIGPKPKGTLLGYKTKDSLDFFNRDMFKLLRFNLITYKYSLYNLRDTFASYLANNNLDMSNVQDLLDHSDAKITRYYAEVKTGYLKKKIDSANFKELIRQRPMQEEIQDDIEDMLKKEKGA